MPVHNKSSKTDVKAYLQSLSSSELLDQARRYCVGKDSMTSRRINAEMAERSLAIWQTVSPRKKEWCIDQIKDEEDKRFIRRVNEIVYAQLAKYISHQIRINTGAYENKHDDSFGELTADYTATLIQDFPFYDERSALTTYFVNRFKGAHQKHNSDVSDVPAHVHDGVVVVKRALEDLEKLGYSEDKIFPEDVQRQIARRKLIKDGYAESEITEHMVDLKIDDKKSNIPKISTITRYIEVSTQSKVPYSTDLLDSSNEGFYISPEAQYLKEEENIAVIDAVNRLPKIERIVVSLREGLFTKETGYFSKRLPNVAIGSHKEVLRAQRELEYELRDEERRRAVVEGRDPKTIPNKVVSIDHVPYRADNFSDSEREMFSDNECLPTPLVQEIYQRGIRHLRASSTIKNLRRQDKAQDAYGTECVFSDVNSELENIFIEEATDDTSSESVE